MSNHSRHKVANSVLVLAWILAADCTAINSSTSTLRGTGISQLKVPDAIKLALVPAWSPTGSKVAFVGYPSQTEINIYVLDVASENTIPILPPREQYPVSNPQWSPDATRIVYSGNSTTLHKAGIWSVEVDSKPEYIAPGYEASWSPDGSKLAVLDSSASGDQIKIIDMRTEASKTIFTIQSKPPQALKDIVWSPDASILAFVVITEENGYEVSHLYRIDADGNHEQALLADRQVTSVADPKWILDGKWIAFLLGMGSDRTLNFIRADGQCIVSPLKNLHDLGSMDILPDGTKAVVESQGNLYMLDVQAALAPQSIAETLVCH